MMPARAAALCVASLILTSASPGGAGPLRIPGSQLEPVSFTDLRGWAEDDHTAAIAAFAKSCDAILRREKAKARAKPLEHALREPCARLSLYRQPVNATSAKLFFEQFFRPVRISKVGEQDGFITGYYEPEIEGSRTPGDGFSVPFYRRPSELVMRAGGASRSKRPSRATASKRTKAGRISPFYDRAQIDNGALAGRGLEIVWVNDEIDAFFTHIQGSARVRLRDGKIIRINYAAQNGHPYLAIGRVLIERGVVTQEEMSMDKIRTYLAEHKEEGRELMRMNRSYVFFREVEGLGNDEEPIGAQGVSLTRDRSIAVDRSLHIYGTPFWIEAELPIESPYEMTPFRQLMIAQDTGGAIVGPARADIYFGAGVDAGTVSGRLRHSGTFYMLVPRSMDPAARLAEVPMPPKRPEK